MAARCVDSISSNLSPTPVLAKLVQILAPLRVFYQDTASSGRFIEARHSAMLNSILLEWAEQTKKIRYTQHSLQSLFPGKTAALLPFKLATTEDEHAKRSDHLAAASASVAASAAVTDMQGKYSHGYARKVRRCRHLDKHAVANSGCESFSQKHAVRFSNLI